jgi:Ni,Fe-hydrogenase III small subunit
MGLCIFCGACSKACPQNAVTFSRDWRLAATKREDLIIMPQEGESAPPVIQPMTGSFRRSFARSLKLRQISAAGCNACEADCNVLTTIVFDLGRFGIDFVASPRHADAILITGPAPHNMHLAIHKCHAAMPEPKFVVAAGACAISGGLFRGFEAGGNGVLPLLAADLFIPGCPPHPYTTLDALLRFLGRIHK